VIDRTLRTKHWRTLRPTRLMANECGVNQTTIWRVWRANGLKPHGIKRFKLSPDPHFVKKLRDVVVALK
jgi:hypothetical protein